MYSLYFLIISNMYIYSKIFSPENKQIYVNCCCCCWLRCPSLHTPSEWCQAAHTLCCCYSPTAHRPCCCCCFPTAHIPCCCCSLTVHRPCCCRCYRAAHKPCYCWFQAAHRLCYCCSQAAHRPCSRYFCQCCSPALHTLYRSQCHRSRSALQSQILEEENDFLCLCMDIYVYIFLSSIDQQNKFRIVIIILKI